MLQRVTDFLAYARGEFRKPNAYLLPLRFFIGLGWMRAAAEKLLDPGWRDGSALVDFLHLQIARERVVFPFYRELIADVFLPGAQALAWIVTAGQLLAGVAIFTGTFANLALLGGLFMNFNFILAGAVNPSAFYVVIQTVLFISNAGAILGVDARLSTRIPLALVVAQPQFERHYLLAEKVGFLALVAASWAVSVYALFHVRDFTPNSVDDPAMILVVLTSLGGLSCLITFFRLRSRAE